jgi:hypothetical protein
LVESLTLPPRTLFDVSTIHRRIRAIILVALSSIPLVLSQFIIYLVEKLKREVEGRSPVTEPKMPPSRSRKHRIRSVSLTTNQTDDSSLHLLIHAVRSADAEEQSALDIIAVHNRHGHATKTWTHPDGLLWLKDLLSRSLLVVGSSMRAIFLNLLSSIHSQQVFLPTMLYTISVHRIHMP